jgi:hypothetical protein
MLATDGENKQETDLNSVDPECMHCLCLSGLLSFVDLKQNVGETALEMEILVCTTRVLLL